MNEIHNNHRHHQQPIVRRVWRNNVNEEMIHMHECLKRFPLISLDTEYPGIVYKTRVDSTNEEGYKAMKGNVENMKLIQCGFTLFDDSGRIGGTWEFNFCNFGDPTDLRNHESIEFLKKHGLDLDMIRRHGVDMFGYGFFPKLMNLFHSQKHSVFITFQGAYDFAYFLSILNHGKLPETHQEFSTEVVRLFGLVYDTKVMAGFCDGLGEHLGLSKLAELLNISRVGRPHHAGSDSLMTALIFIKLRDVYEDSKLARGIIHGIGKEKLITVPPPPPSAPMPPPQLEPIIPEPMPLMCQQNLASYPMWNNGYVANYNQQQPQVYYLDHLGAPWTPHNGLLVPFTHHHLPSSTFAYPSQPAVQYLQPFPSYYNNNTCYVVE